MFTTAHVDYQTYKSEEGRLAEKAFFQHHGPVSENFACNIVQARTRPGELAPDLRWLFGSIDGYSMCRVKGPADGTVSSEHVAVRSEDVCNSALVVENTLQTSTALTYGQHATL